MYTLLSAVCKKWPRQRYVVATVVVVPANWIQRLRHNNNFEHDHGDYHDDDNDENDNKTTITMIPTTRLTRMITTMIITTSMIRSKVIPAIAMKSTTTKTRITMTTVITTQNITATKRMVTKLSVCVYYVTDTLVTCVYCYTAGVSLNLAHSLSQLYHKMVYFMGLFVTILFINHKTCDKHWRYVWRKLRGAGKHKR